MLGTTNGRIHGPKISASQISDDISAFGNNDIVNIDRLNSLIGNLEGELSDRTKQRSESSDTSDRPSKFV